MSVERSLRYGESRPRTGDEIRKAFLSFFSERGHQVLPSASLVPEDPTVLLTIAGMLPFKPVFLGQAERPAARATTSQKCIRTNDIDNVGVTARHHTFFEMLGNFSFGDYFKKEAIQWAWELSTKVFELNSKNLVVSIFREDDEAEKIWREDIGVNPDRIIRMDETDNFWSSGPTGPCGPCSELYYDFKPELGTLEIDLDDDSRFIEFYNLVFMEYNRDAKGNLTKLNNCNIDTGMGLERMAQILQGAPNNYETDLIFPLIEKAAALAGVQYANADQKLQISLKVIGDHSRAVTQLISDGVIASNLGRGYILRRLLRRVVRHGRLIGIDQPFLHEMGEAAIQLMQIPFPQLLERKEVILNELKREEARFLETLERGEKLLIDVLASKPKQITGQQAFELYDTFGFPVELTQEIAQDNGIGIDLVGFEQAMEAQRQRAKAANISIDLTLKGSIEETTSQLEETIFVGYESLNNRANVQALLVNGERRNEANQGDDVEVMLDTTTFYGEGGGQIGDRGVLLADVVDPNGMNVVVNSVSRHNNVFVHSGCIKKGSLRVGDQVDTCVDTISRRRIQANHTSTHLLQAALKQIIDPSISQAGSLVDFDRLRFDFNSSRAITLGELVQVEDLINRWINESHGLKVKNMQIDEAKANGAVAMFGEKYSEIVRVVDVPGVSMELCGGTHVSNTSEISIFKIVAESSIASGVRRIEAVAGPAAFDYLNERDEVVKKLADQFKIQPSEIFERVLQLQEEVKLTNKALTVANEELALSKVMSSLSEVKAVANSQLIVKRLDSINGTALQTAAQRLLGQLGENSAVVFGGVPDLDNQDKVIFVAAFGNQLISSHQLNAGKFIGSIAKMCGGGGGGRPNLAQAGGRDSKSLDLALQEAESKLLKLLS